MLKVTHITPCDMQYVKAACDISVLFVAQCTLVKKKKKQRNGLWLNEMNSNPFYTFFLTLHYAPDRSLRLLRSKIS